MSRKVKECDGYQRQRLLVQPGMTFYRQFRPRCNSLNFDEWIGLDIKYIREHSLRMAALIRCMKKAPKTALCAKETKKEPETFRFPAFSGS